MVKKLFLKTDKSPKNIQIKKDIINHFITTGNDTIAELARELELSVPTITKFITELKDQGLIIEFGKYTPGGDIQSCTASTHLGLLRRGGHEPTSPSPGPDGFHGQHRGSTDQHPLHVRQHTRVIRYPMRSHPTVHRQSGERVQRKDCKRELEHLGKGEPGIWLQLQQLLL